ncbi:MAG: hypothetical protein ACM3WP_25725 [Acidobacteriota bacterium]
MTITGSLRMAALIAVLSIMSLAQQQSTPQQQTQQTQTQQTQPQKQSAWSKFKKTAQAAQQLGTNQ